MTYITDFRGISLHDTRQKKIQHVDKKHDISLPFSWHLYDTFWWFRSDFLTRFCFKCHILIIYWLIKKLRRWGKYWRVWSDFQYEIFNLEVALKFVHQIHNHRPNHSNIEEFWNSSTNEYNPIHYFHDGQISKT